MNYNPKMPLQARESCILDKSIEDLHSLQSEHIRGVMFRSKAKWNQDGEKNSKYFLNLEKSRYNAKNARCCYVIIKKSEIKTKY